jgi:uncharacterized protein
MLRIGVISDSHGKFEARIEQAFEGVDAILHAGDICDVSVLFRLEAIAQVTAVLGNCDTGPAFDRLPPTAEKTFEGVRVLMAHDKAYGKHLLDGVDVFVFGHSHMPMAETVDGVLWLNPGSAQQARQSPLGRSVALLHVNGEHFEAQIVPLDELSDKE